MLSRIPSYTGSLERKHKLCWWWQRLLVWHPRWGDLSAVEWICKQRKTVQGVIKGCRRNQHTVRGLHLPFYCTPSPLHTKKSEILGESMTLRFLLKMAALSAIRARNSYPESHDGTWSRVAGAQGCTRCIHPQRAGWTHWGPSEVLETFQFCCVVRQPEGRDIIKCQ